MIYTSIVDKSIFNEFREPKGISLMNHAANTCNIEDFIAVSNILCPEVVEVDECIFIGEFYHNNVQELKKRFSNDRKKIEQWVNTWSLGDFFVAAYTDSVENKKIIKQFGEILVYFWKKRLNELFPNKNIIVEVGKEIMGENGLAITVYQE